MIMQKFDPVESCKYIEKYKITQMLVVPPMCLLFTHHPAVSQYNMTSLKMLMSGAAPLGAPLVHALRSRLKSVGAEVFVGQGQRRRQSCYRNSSLTLWTGYGLTETSPTTHMLPTQDSLRKIGSIGPLNPNLEARLVIEDVQEAGPGEPGELWLRGPTIMKVRGRSDG